MSINDLTLRQIEIAKILKCQEIGIYSLLESIHKIEELIEIEKRVRS